MLIISNYKDNELLKDTHLTMSEANDKGFQSVGRSFDAKLTDAQILALKKKLGVKEANVVKWTKVYTLMQEGKSIPEIQRMGIYQKRVLVDISSTLFPKRKNTKKLPQNVVHF